MFTDATVFPDETVNVFNRSLLHNSTLASAAGAFAGLPQGFFTCTSVGDITDCSNCSGTCCNVLSSRRYVVSCHISGYTPVPSITLKAKSDSASTQHIKSAPTCLKSSSTDVSSYFSAVVRERSRSHHNALEAICIARLKPDVCLQKEFVRSSYLF